jgi:type II secretory pathway pseudopilin PulG
MKRGKSFTVIEILTVVIIMAILATLALPPLVRTMDAAKGRLAKTNLKLIYAAQKVYRNEVGQFMPYGTGERLATTDDFKKFLGLDLQEKDFAYKVESGGNTFTATATYQGSRAQYRGKTITIDQDGNIISLYPPSP